MIHDARIEKPATAAVGSHKGMSDPVVIYDWDGLYGIAFWDDNDNQWHEIIDGREEIYGDGIIWWADIMTPRGWNYDSDYYSSGYAAEKLREESEAMEKMGYRIPHRFRNAKGEEDAQENNNP